MWYTEDQSTFFQRRKKKQKELTISNIHMFRVVNIFHPLLLENKLKTGKNQVIESIVYISL